MLRLISTDAEVVITAPYCASYPDIAVRSTIRGMSCLITLITLLTIIMTFHLFVRHSVFPLFSHDFYSPYWCLELLHYFWSAAGKWLLVAILCDFKVTAVEHSGRNPPVCGLRITELIAFRVETFYKLFLLWVLIRPGRITLDLVISKIKRQFTSGIWAFQILTIYYVRPRSCHIFYPTCLRHFHKKSNRCYLQFNKIYLVFSQYYL